MNPILTTYAASQYTQKVRKRRRHLLDSAWTVSRLTMRRSAVASLITTIFWSAMSELIFSSNLAERGPTQVVGSSILFGLFVAMVTLVVLSLIFYVHKKSCDFDLTPVFYRADSDSQENPRIERDPFSSESLE